MAVIGPNADSHAALVGNYNGTPPRSITVVEGITRICEDTGWDVNYAEGCLLYDDPSVRKVFQNYRIPEAVALAESCDLAIVCVGLDSTLEGEQGDVGNALPVETARSAASQDPEGSGRTGHRYRYSGDSD